MRALELPHAGVVAVLASGGALLALVIAGFALPVLAIAILAPILAMITQRPQRGVLLLVALVPFHGLLTIANLPPVFDAWKEVLGGVVFVATFVCPVSERASRGRPRPPWLAPLAAFVVLGFVSAASTHDLEALIGLKIDFYWILIGIAVWRCPFNESERDRLVTILMSVGFICALIGLWQQVVGPAALNALGYEYETAIRFAGGIMRSFATFAEPFAYAFFLMTVLLVATPAALARPSRLRNRLYLLAMPILMLALLSTVVRAGVLGVGVGFAYLGVRRHRVLLAALPLAFVLIVVLGALGGALSSTFASGSSFAERQAGWEENFVELTRHPFGVGIGSSGAAAATAAGDTPTRDLYNPDNYYFKTVYELGVLGLWFLVVFLGMLFTATKRLASRVSARDGPLLEGVAAMILGSLAACFVANLFDSFPTNVYFAVLVGVVAARGARQTAEDDDELEDAAVAA